MKKLAKKYAQAAAMVEQKAYDIGSGLDTLLTSQVVSRYPFCIPKMCYIYKGSEKIYIYTCLAQHF